MSGGNLSGVYHFYTMAVTAATMVYTYVTGYENTEHFAHYFKIELLVFQGSVDLKQ